MAKKAGTAAVLDKQLNRSLQAAMAATLTPRAARHRGIEFTISQTHVHRPRIKE